MLIQRTLSYLIFIHNLFIHNFFKLLLCINKNESISGIHKFKYPWNLFQSRIQLSWKIFWLRIIELCVFPYSVIFWVIKDVHDTAFIYKVLHYCLWIFSHPRTPSYQVWCLEFLNLTKVSGDVHHVILTAAWPRVSERSKGFILIVELFKVRKRNAS